LLVWLGCFEVEMWLLVFDQVDLPLDWIFVG
jgi:hypothetical protein